MSFPIDAFSNILALSSVIDPNSQLEIRMDNSDSGQIQYLGKSVTPNASTSEKIWYIVAFFYDDNGFLNHVQLPDNGSGFLYSWDDRATYF